MKKWECMLCGYIHEGTEPPDTCPICGAGREYFTKVAQEAEGGNLKPARRPETVASDSPRQPKVGGIPGLVLALHLHPIMVHTPNGVLPLALLLLAGTALFEIVGFELAAFYSLVFVLAAMPLVLITGYLEWQHRYQGLKSSIFMLKIGASIVVTTTLAALVIWRLVNPAIMSSESKWVYLLTALVMVTAAGIAGHLGGKLVYAHRKS